MYVVVYAKKSNLMTSDNIWIVTQVIFATCFIMFYHVSSLSSFVQDSVILYLVMFEGSFRLKKKKDTNHPPGPFTQWWRWRSKGTWRYPDRIWSKRSRYVKILISCAWVQENLRGFPSKGTILTICFLRIMTGSFFKKTKPWHQLTRTQLITSNGELFTSIPTSFQPPPRARSAASKSLMARCRRCRFASCWQQLQRIFSSLDENAQVLSLDVHDWYDHGDTKETTFHMHRQIYLERSVWV